MPRPIVALLTDFGTRDHYSGVMKGVVLGICPDVTLVDVTHDLPPHDIAFAAHELAATYQLLSRRARSSWSSSIPAWARRGAGWRPKRRTGSSSRPTTAC